MHSLHLSTGFHDADAALPCAGHAGGQMHGLQSIGVPQGSSSRFGSVLPSSCGQEGNRRPCFVNIHRAEQMQPSAVSHQPPQSSWRKSQPASLCSKLAVYLLLLYIFFMELLYNGCAPEHTLATTPRLKYPLGPFKVC